MTVSELVPVRALATDSVRPVLDDVERMIGPVPNAPDPCPAEIPDDFNPSDAMLRWANATYPGLDLHFETDQFVRYWQAEGRRKKSWATAWQKWIADSHKRQAQDRSRASPRRESVTNARVAEGMRLAARFAETERQALPP